MGSDSGGNVETAEGLTREAENIGSEAYAQKRETLEEEWQKCYGVLEEKYLQLMNRNICLHTGEGWEELLQRDNHTGKGYLHRKRRCICRDNPESTSADAALQLTYPPDNRRRFLLCNGYDTYLCVLSHREEAQLL